MTDIVRCGDADRERTSARLRDAAGSGHLTMDELEERLTSAYAAKHSHELDALVHDLPPATPAWATSWASVLARSRMHLGQLSGRNRAIAVAVLAVLGFALLGFEVFEPFDFDDD